MRNDLMVFKDLNFSIAPGSIAQIFGRNGCGKTTLLRTLAGLMRPFAGSFSLHPENVSYVDHNLGLNNTVSVRENLHFWHYETDLETVAQSWEISPLLDIVTDNLSLGQKKRLSLSYLDACRHKKVWLLDEPTHGLDVRARNILLSKVHQHKERGGIILIAGHEQLFPKATLIDLEEYSCLLY
jgi:heme exporter protein A